MRIGIVDSGIGGLTTLKEVANRVNGEYFYYMDRKNMPFGDKPKSELDNIADNVLTYMNSVNVDIIILACNTLSNVECERLRANSHIPIVCIEPSIKQASKGKTLVLATKNTVNSEKYKKLTSQFSNVKSKYSLTLAPLIENGKIDEAEDEIKSLVAGEDIENIVLGCTHYVFMKNYVEALGYRVFEGNKGVARQVKRLQTMKHMDSETRRSRVYLHMTDVVDLGFIVRYLGQGVIFV